MAKTQKMPTAAQVNAALSAVALAAKSNNPAKLEAAQEKLTTLVSTAQTVASAATANASKVSSGEVSGKAASAAVAQAKNVTTELAKITASVAKVAQTGSISQTGGIGTSSTVKLPDSIKTVLSEAASTLKPALNQTRSTYYDAAIETATSRDAVNKLVIEETKSVLTEQGKKPQEITAAVKDLTASLKTEKSIEADQVRNLERAGKANEIALTKTMQDAGASKADIKAAVNDVRLDTKNTIASFKQESIQNPGTVQFFDSKSQTVTTYNQDGRPVDPREVNQNSLPRSFLQIQNDALSPEIKSKASGIVKTAVDTANKYNIPQLDISMKVDKGIGTDSLVKAELTKDLETGKYSSKTQTGKLLNLSQTYIGSDKSFTPDQIVTESGKKIKLTPVKEPVIDPATGQTTNYAYAKVGDKYVSFRQNQDGTYTGIGSTYVKIDTDDSFWNSPLGQVVRIGAYFVPGGQVIGPAINAIAAYDTSGGDIGAAITSVATSYFVPKIGDFISKEISGKISSELISQGVSEAASIKTADMVASATTNAIIGKALNPDANIAALVVSGAASGYGKSESSDLAKVVLGGGDAEKGNSFIQDIVKNTNLTQQQIENAVSSAVGQAAVGVATGEFDANKIALNAAATLGGGSVGNAVKDKILAYEPELIYAANAGKVISDVGTQAAIRGQDPLAVLTSSASYIAKSVDDLSKGPPAPVEERSTFAKKSIQQEIDDALFNPKNTVQVAFQGPINTEALTQLSRNASIELMEKWGARAAQDPQFLRQLATPENLNALKNAGMVELATAVSTLSGVAAGGAAATALATGTLAAPGSEVLRKAMQDNPMLGAMGGDASFAGSLIDVWQNASEKTKTLPAVLVETQALSPKNYQKNLESYIDDYANPNDAVAPVTADVDRVSKILNISINEAAALRNSPIFNYLTGKSDETKIIDIDTMPLRERALLEYAAANQQGGTSFIDDFNVIIPGKTPFGKTADKAIEQILQSGETKTAPNTQSAVLDALKQDIINSGVKLDQGTGLVLSKNDATDQAYAIDANNNVVEIKPTADTTVGSIVKLPTEAPQTKPAEEATVIKYDADSKTAIVVDSEGKTSVVPVTSPVSTGTKVSVDTSTQTSSGTSASPSTSTEPQQTTQPSTSTNPAIQAAIDAALNPSTSTSTSPSISPSISPTTNTSTSTLTNTSTSPYTNQSTSPPTNKSDFVAPSVPSASETSSNTSLPSGGESSVAPSVSPTVPTGGGGGGGGPRGPSREELEREARSRRRLQELQQPFLLPSSQGSILRAPYDYAFYYGKPFESPKQEISKEGELLQKKYQPLSVTQPGPELALGEGTGENALTALLQSVLGEEGDINDLLEILRG
jgi:hypothetical protein